MKCILRTVEDHKNRMNMTKIQKGHENKSPNEDIEKTCVQGFPDQDDSGFDTSDSSDEKKRKQRLKCIIPSASRSTSSTSIVVNKKCLERQH